MHDFVIVGSGFGGAVAACRLACAGRGVMVLERGRRWQPEDYPRESGDAWLFDVDAPHRCNGWIDMRFMDDMVVVQGAGVGGGSLIYANVSVDAPDAMLRTGWPSQISGAELAPHYASVSQMLKPETLPDNQLTRRFKLMRVAARKTGARDRFRKLELAVSFDPEGKPPKIRPEREIAARTFTNEFGCVQGYCIHCGNCDIGCKVQAKNTLDLNYLAKAERAGACIQPLSVVSHVVQEENGFAVIYDDISTGQRIERIARAKNVILAAGSLGSTEILFRSRDLFKTLPGVSAALGKRWSSNGDFLTPAFYKNLTVSPSLGVTISSAIDYLDGMDGAARYFVEDGGFPSFIGNALRAKTHGKGSLDWKVWFFRRMAARISNVNPAKNMMPWFGQAVDGGDGDLYYGRDWMRPWKKRLKLDWDPKRSERAINALKDAHLRLSEATGGRAVVPFTWSVFRALVTPHPLGGCAMAASPAAGVVDHGGSVFGHPGLFVMDGAVIPRPIGLNPSKTIAALAERAVSLMMR